ncbi:fungal trichothecene efflux pump [Protomyces lactucae-debilis]|uniref:Fungal trichothecene efflux pump n=1 Tax=Protomyces lactucae-debilis TaxID=2754530 RepID=A0A1Y2FUL1_PROLT|nr:fungal trichothecene efflux pump [Protomyces lactucae-debilis]ORY86964.1 fungal trichothecene efflux pump [Protomyces lactucae-debilis]
MENNFLRHQPGLVSEDNSSEGSSHGRDLEKTQTGQSGKTVERSATGQAQLGADEDVKIDAKTFIACLAISFLWTGSQIPLYMLLACIDYTLADVGGADIQIWFILGPLTALAATSPIAGSVSDIFGRRWTILIGGILLIVGLIIHGTPKTAGQIIVALPFEGVGAALLEINALAAVNEIAPNKLRGFYTSMLIWTIIPFAPLGVYALLLAEHATWRWVVWISVIWVAIGQVLTFFFYHPPPRVFHGKVRSLRERLALVDWVGSALALIGLVLFLVGLGTGGYTRPWKSALPITLIILGFLFLVATGVWSSFAKDPLLPPGMFKNARVFTLTLVITAVAGANFFSILILWPKFVISVFVPSATLGGCLIMAQTVGVLFGAGFFSWTITQFKGSIRPQMCLSCCLMIAGFGSLAAVGYQDNLLAGFMVFLGSVGVGGIIIPASVITQLCTPDEYLGTVTAFTFVARVIGGAIGFTIYYYILNHRMEQLFLSFATNRASLNVVSTLLGIGLNQVQITDFLRHFAISDVKYLRALPKVKELTIQLVALQARPIWAQGFQDVWYTTIAFSGLGLICSVFLGDVSKYMTNHRAVHL